MPVTERWNNSVEFHGKNDQPRKNLDKLKIYIYFFENGLMGFFDGKPCLSPSFRKA